MSNEIQKVDSDVVAKLQEAMELGFSASQMKGFEKAFSTANAIMMLEKALTNEVMKPIMCLQGTKLGFRTDKDIEGGYPMQVVRKCLIEGVLNGLQPTMNQINIIASSMYITKEGFTELLSKIDGLNYSIVCDPGESLDRNKARVIVHVEWEYLGKAQKQDLKYHIPLQYSKSGRLVTLPDALTGKAERKAKCWLYNKVTGNTLTDGEAEKQVEDQTNTAEVQDEIEQNQASVEFEKIEVVEEEKVRFDKDIPGQQKIDFDDTDDMKI